MSLKKIALHGVKWSAFSQVGRQGLQFVTTIVLAQMLHPSDFGLIGMAIVITGFIEIIKDLGTSATIIHQKEISESFVNNIFWINILFSLLASFFLIGSAPLVSSFYKEPQVSHILQALAFSFSISGIGTVYQALLEKKLKFQTLARIELIATFIGALAGISSAFIGAGAWSLVYQNLFIVISSTILLVRTSDWRPKLTFNLQEVKSFSSYSSNLTGFNIFNYLIRNIDYLLIGRVLGSEALGFYTLAYRIMLYPLQSISRVINRVGFPLFSKFQEDDIRFRSAYLRVVAMTSMVSFPLMFGIWALAELLVVTVFGLHWKATIPILLILAPVGLVQSISSTVGTIYQSKGRTDWMFRWSIFAGIFTVCGFVIGLRWNIIGVAAGYAIANLILVYPCFAIPFRLVNLSMARFAAVLWRPLMCSAIMSCLILGIQAVLPMSFSPALNLGISILIGGATYVVVSQWINHDQMRQLFNLLGLIE